MAKAIAVIPTTMQTLMKADSDFNSANAIYNGPWFRLANEYYPVITIVMLSEEEPEQHTGNVYFRRYGGMVQVEAVIQEIASITTRTGKSTAGETVNLLTNAVIAFFREAANQNLGNPAIDNGAVSHITIGNNVAYIPMERDNTYTWQSNVEFTVEVKETV